MKKLDFNEVFSTGWERFSAQVGPAILWTLVYIVGILVLGILSLVIVGIIFMPLWQAGYVEVMRKLYNDEQPEFSDFFVHKDKLGQLWLLVLAVIVIGIIFGMLYFIAILLPIFWAIAVPAAIFGETVIGGVVLISLMLIIDKNMDAITAIKSTWERIKEEFWMFFALFLIAGLIGSIFAIVTAPFALLVMWATYYVLFPRTEGVPGPGAPMMPLQ